LHTGKPAVIFSDSRPKRGVLLQSVVQEEKDDAHDERNNSREKCVALKFGGSLTTRELKVTNCKIIKSFFCLKLFQIIYLKFRKMSKQIALSQK